MFGRFPFVENIVMRQSVAVGGLNYQRTIIGYHGCDESVVRDVLVRGRNLRPSENDYDWLGRGIYFWEHGPRRAYEWARHAKQVKEPAVIGAFINLGNCFDLLDTNHTQLLTDLFPLYRQACEATGTPLAANLPRKGQASSDLMLRRLDCAVINWCLDFLETEERQHYHTVRCLFSEGSPVFEGSKILAKSHVQVAVRDHTAIVGYFKPRVDK
jgi:hypothetical protein